MINRAADVGRFLLRSFRAYGDENRILIYQMGKVGSTSLAQALGDRALQIHNFYPSNEPCPRKPRYRGTLRKRAVHWLFYQVIRAAVRRRKTLKIISLVRDPISRNVSMYFHDLYYWLAYYFGEVRPDRVGDEGIDTLLDCFSETFDHRYPLEWFDRELKRLTGIDVYDHAFDRAAGCTKIEAGRVSLLIIQTDKLGECWQKVEEFCGRKLEFREDNRARRKWYGTLYSQFLDRYSLSTSELDAIYSSRYATFFFSEETRTLLKKRWQGQAREKRTNVG